MELFHIKQRILILASSSPRRQELIRIFNLPVQIYASDVNEETQDTLSPAEVVETLSLRKAQAVADQTQFQDSSGIVIGSDTIVVLENQILGKPSTIEHAEEMLQSLQGNWHQVFSGVACIDMNTGTSLVNHRMTRVKMKKLDVQQIKRYIDHGESMDKAGAYGIQGTGSLLIESIEGCYFNVVGLPLTLLGDMLSELGVEVI
jgi:septum formation protein